MRKYLKFITVLLLCAICFYHQAGAQTLSAEAKLDSTSIRIGDQTKLHFTVYQPAKARINFPQLADTLTGKILIVDKSKLDTAFEKNDKSRLIVSQTYTITGFDAGTYTIPSYKFGSAADTLLKTNELVLQVQTVKVDTTKGIYDIKQPIAVKFTWLDWLRENWVWVVVPLVIIALIVGFIIYWVNRPKKVAGVAVVKQHVPPHVLALNKLHELRAKKLWQQEQVKLYYSELSDILRDYLEVRYLIKTQEKTTDEILLSLRHIDIKDDSKQLLKQILVLSDLVKFAKEKPLPAENEQSIDNAISFINNTLQVFTPQADAEGGNTNEPA